MKFAFKDDQEDQIFELTPFDAPNLGTAKKSLSLSLALKKTGFRRIILMCVLGISWDFYARWLDNPLLIPDVSSIARAFFDGIWSGVLLDRLWNSLAVLLFGYVIGIALAGFMTSIAFFSSWGRELLLLLAAMFNPLPAIALLPLAMLWFGLGSPSLIFVLVHSVVWVMAMNAMTGFDGVGSNLRMVGKNYGLKGFRFICKILIPAALPNLLAGLKISWAFAWRTLIAAELVFGVAAGSGGLGWFIYENKNQLEIPSVFAGLCAVIIIGLAVEQFIFRIVEEKTIVRWGVSRQ